VAHDGIERIVGRRATGDIASRDVRKHARCGYGQVGSGERGDDESRGRAALRRPDQPGVLQQPRVSSARLERGNVLVCHVLRVARAHFTWQMNRSQPSRPMGDHVHEVSMPQPG